jgi:hypothetical protein|tara:strand:- start:119 stop:310 length:192 start_codon:yes stop_codon:yes gene_type:complete
MDKEEFWNNNANKSIIILASCLKNGLNLKPNSQKQIDAYDKGVYALEIVAAQLDKLYEIEESA